MDERPARALDGPRFAFGVLTILPVGAARWDRTAARSGMCWAPVTGLVLGLFSAAVGGVLLALGASGLLAATVTVGVPAALTRGLHLDGLADVADGLGSGKDAHGAQSVMRRSDIGPFGVLTLVLTLLGQVAAIAQLYEESWAYGAVGFTVALVTARTALTCTARQGVEAARADGLGAMVASVVPRGLAVTVALSTVVVSGLVALPLFGGGKALGAVVAVSAGLLAAEMFARRCRRRLGGVSGDVFGAVVEVGGTATLLVWALS